MNETSSTASDLEPIDLATLNPEALANEGVEFELKHPVSGKGLGVFITVLGIDSEVAQDLGTRHLEKAQRAQRTRSGAPAYESPEQAKARAVDFDVACTKGWRGMRYKGAELVFSQANARTLYNDIRWIREQVDQQISDLGNFLPS